MTKIKNGLDIITSNDLVGMRSFSTLNPFIQWYHFYNKKQSLLHAYEDASLVVGIFFGVLLSTYALSYR